MEFIIELSYEEEVMPYLKENQRVSDFYRENYKKDGWLYFNDSIYYICEIPFLPQEGQRLETKLGISIVEYSILSILENQNDFYDKSRIVIHQE